MTDLTTAARLRRRTTFVLIGGVVPAGAAYAGAFSAMALAGQELTGSGALGTLAASATTLGGATAAVPLAQRMARVGRRPGLVAAWSAAAAGAAMAGIGVAVGLYPLLLVGAFVLGAASAGTLATRFAAADLAPEEGKGKAIGLLVWAGSFGAVVGPSVALGPVGGVADAFGLPPLAGPFIVAAMLLGVSALIIERLLRPDPLEVLGTIPAPTMSGGRNRLAEAREPLRLIAANPVGRLAALAMLLGHAVMVGVMTATPLHMRSGDHALRVIGLVISLHIVGMYFFAPVVGWVVDRIGGPWVLMIGGITLAVGAMLAARTDAVDSQGVFVGLFLIGVGWSCGLVAGSSLLIKAFPVQQRVQVQGAADLLMAGAGATASLLGGVTFDLSGFRTLAQSAALVALLITVAGFRAALARRQAPAGI